MGEGEYGAEVHFGADATGPALWLTSMPAPAQLSPPRPCPENMAGICARSACSASLCSARLSSCRG